jgi:hypothetical protein
MKKNNNDLDSTKLEDPRLVSDITTDVDEEFLWHPNAEILKKKGRLLSSLSKEEKDLISYRGVE